MNFNRGVAGGGVAIPELTLFVVAPTLDVAGGKHRTRMGFAGGDLGGVTDPLNFDRGVAGGGVAIPELPELVKRQLEETSSD